MTELKEIRTVNEATVGNFIEDVLSMLIDRLGLDIGSEENADLYDEIDGSIADFVEEHFGISNADWSKYHIYKEE